MSIQVLTSELRKEVPVEWQRERRVEWLKGRITGLIIEAWTAMDFHEDFVRRNRMIEMILAQEHLQMLLKKIVKAQAEIISLRGSGWQGKNDITPEMIERARAFPFTQLYQFQRNAARCPFHEDRTPSFMLMKNNTVRCFGACSKNWDTIAFLMDMEGLKFPQAVRRLQ